MSGAVALGLVCGLGSALALNWGYVAQHGAAAALPPLTLRRPVASLRVLFAHRRWLAGFVVGIGGWALYVAGLRVAPLSLVQAVSAGGIGVLALLAWRLAGVRPERREALAVLAALGGLVALAASLSASAPHGVRGDVVPIVVWVLASAAAALAVVATGASTLRAGAPFGIAAGLLYAGGDVATKAALGGGGRLGFAAVMLACHGLAFVALQLGFQRGGVLATAGLASLMTNALPIVAGVVLFGEALPGGAAGAARVLAFVAVVFGAAGLAHGTSEAGGPVSAGERRAEPARAA